MNKKVVTCLLLASLAALTFAAIQSSMADVITDNYIDYGSGVSLYSPLNKTYTSNLIPLSLNFSKGTGMDCDLSYSLDGQSSHDIPLTVIPGQELHITTETTATLQLPPLSDGTHILTITVNASAGSSYAHTWVHTVYFTVQTGNPSASPSPAPTSTIENIDANITPTAQPPAEEIQQNQMPLMIVIIVAAFAAYIAVIAVLSSKKIR